MTYSFNLIDQPWIPCTDVQGVTREYGLRQALRQAHRLRGIAGDTPLETAAIYRLVLAVLHSALRGPASASEWYQLWQEGCWDSPTLHDYLDRWRHRFDLFDPERPFYQARDPRVKPKSVISLAMEMASGNNASLFDHHIEEEGAQLSCAKAARVLIAAQTFGLAGLSGLEQKFTDAPWTRGILFLVEGDTLFETLVMNLLRYDDLHPIGFEMNPQDRPAWEADDPYFPERKIPQGYLDYLTWQNRRILLLPEGETNHPFVSQFMVAPALRLDENLLDPFKHYRRGEKQEKWLPLRFSEERALWRDFSALLQFNQPQKTRPPVNFEWIANLVDKEYLAKYQMLRFMALGMANNQAKIEFFQENHLPLPVAYLKDEAIVTKLGDSLQQAEAVYARLREAAQRLALLTISPTADGKRWQEIDRISKDQAEQLCRHWGVDRLFWGRLELPFIRFLEELPQRETALDDWQTVIRQTAWEALEYAASQAGDQSIALKAAVRARSLLGGRLNEIFEKSQKEVTT